MRKIGTITENKNEKSFFYMYIFPVILVSLLIFGVLDIFVFNWFYDSEPDFKIYLNEIEVDELVACCFGTDEINPFENLSNNGGETNLSVYPDAVFCLPEENLEYFEVPCKTIKKDELDKEFLTWNAECIEIIIEGKIYNTKGEIYELSMSDKSKQKYCQKYKFGEYFIKIK